MSFSKVKTLLLHIPHSGREFFKSQREHQDLFLDRARNLIDYYTDELFSPDVKNKQIIPVVFPYCRTVCDVERMTNDPLEEKNLGIQYDKHNHIPKYGFLNIDGKEFSSDNSIREYIKHHHMVESIIFNNKVDLVIDCHSFSSQPTVVLPNCKDLEKYDICIGFNEDETKPCKVMLSFIIDYFSKCGYKVGVNTPFSNSKTFNTPCSYFSFMIEVNKRLYMDEDSLEKTDGFNTIHKQLLDLYSKLMD